MKKTLKIIYQTFLITLTFATCSFADVSINLNSGWNLIESSIILKSKCKAASIASLKMVVFSEKGSISCSETEYYQTGKGLWVYVDAPLTVSAPTESSNSSITVNLVSGWNLIGNPYGSDIKKSDVVFLIDGEPFINSVDVRHELYSFDALSNTYTQADVLKPGMAYWVFVNNPSVLTFFAEKPKDPNPAVPGTPLAEDKDDLGNPFAKGEMIIQLIDEKDGQFQTVLTQINGTALSESKALGLYRIKVNNTKNAFRLINSYKNYWAQSNPPIKVVASLNYLLKASAYAPDDPPYQTGGDKTQVWGFEKIKAPEVWKTFTPKSAPVVAVIDTGVSGTHAELAGRLVGGANFLYGDASAPDSDANGHGTQIAGLIAAQQDNGKGISGVCFDCKIMPVKVCDNSGNCPLFSVLNGIVYAADNSAGVINISLSGGIAADQIDNITKIFATVVDYAKNKNALVVAAAGNANASAANYVPGAVAGVLSVGATDQNDQSTDFTNYGPSVVISAPGFSIYSTNIPDNYSFGSGTSLSAALVSGAAGVLRSAVPTLSVDQMKQILISTADVISTSKQIGPRLNLRKAMEFIVPMTPQFEIISLTPASVMANPGEVVELAVQTTIAGNTGVVFNWTVTGGTLLDKGAGNVSWTAPATQEDYTITVEAVSPYGYKDTASSMAKVLAVSLPVATTISVSPAFITLDVGMQQFFTAEVKDQYNNPITAALKWSYDNNTATVTANGMLTALQAGQGELTVSTANGLSATATVFVIDNTPPINPAACGGGCTCCVTNNDGGTIAGSLRACLTFANGNAGHDNICLDPLLGNGVTVSPTAAIANITDQAGVTLDFTGRDFRLDGTSAVVGDGLYIRSSNNIVRGIQFVKFDGGPGNYAITIDGAVGATGNIIAGNTFGTYTGDPAGVAQRNNGGIQLRGGASNNTIGGNTPADRNLFVNNQTSSIDINSANNNIIQGNYFGVNRTGTGAFPSADRVNRIRVRNTSSGNIIGGDSTAGEGNLISGSNGYGIELNGGSVIGTLIRGNIIGADLTGTVSVPNVSGGILIVGNANNSIVGGAAGTNFGNLISGNSSHGIYINNAWSSNNVIIGNKIGTKIDGITALANNGWGVNIIANANIVGTTAAGEGNIIAYNTSGGVTVNASINDKVSGNSMFLNGGLAIDLVGGANNNIAAPNITGFVATAWNVYTVTGTVTMANANVEIYRVNNAAAPVVGQDPTNRGELFQLICTTDAVGLNFTASNCNVAVGDYISGISRNTANNDTSEAGLNRQITNIAPVANAGLDQTFNSPGSLVTLDGSASSDGNYDTLTYAWTQTAGPVIALSDSAAVGPTFTPAVCGNYTFRLIVNDSHVNSAADFVNVTVNCVPVANAGLDQFLDSPGLLVTLDGSASSDANGDPLTYAWTQTGGVAVVLSSNTAQKPTFTPATCGDYTFSLVVNDTHIDSAADSVVITVNCVPVANAGPDQLVIQPGVLVTLDGSASADADGDPLTYAWTQTGGAAVVLSNSAAVGPTFTPATCGNYTFSLTVNDTHINSAADSVAVRINCVPVANAGPDQLINQPGVLVTLDGSASADADGDPLTYAWTQTGGAAVVLSSNTAQKPTFTPVTCGNYSFSLVVNDTNINSPADSVAIRINCAPVANAGPDQTPPAPGALVTLDGSASADADGDPLTYAWTQTGGVAVVLSNAAAQMPTFTPATCGNYVFSLVVNDTHIDSAADSVTISVNCVPVANAGPDQFKIQPGVLVTLDGSASSDANLDPLTYAWTQSAGPAVVLSDSTLVNPTFTPALPGTYTFSLIVNDGLINSAADTVTITVNAVPVANAGPDQAIPSPAVLVTLDGSGSSDADSDPLTYAWSQTGGPAVVALSDPTAQNPTFTPPVAGSYTFQLIVNDGHINSAADVVVIATNAPPVADAGPDQLVIQNGILITLDGSASSDANLDPLTYSWTQTSGTAVVLSSNTAQQPTFTPALCGSYIFSLVVNDGQINSVADSVTIHVNCVPVANAGPDQLIIQPGILVTLDGSASSDANFDPLTYAWTQTSGPAVILSNATLVNPTFTPALPGSYTFSLIVNDGHINSVASVVTITVNTVPVANAGPDQAPPAPGALVTLDGSASADADGDPLTYAWTQTGGAAVVLSSNTAQKPTFTPATCGNYDFSLVVNDTHINSAADSVSIKVNCVPVANAGPDQFINQPAILVTLDGSASSDANLDPLTYAWTQTAGPAVVLSNPAAVGPTFTPATPGVYTFNLIVNDGIINSAADTVTITVNTVPVANAGPDQLVIQPGVLVTLDGSASSDADGDPITYAWTQTSGAAVVLSSNTAQKPTFTPASCGNYTFSLVVNDSHINSAADTVAIRINCVPVANAGPDQAPPAPGALVTLDGSASSDADGDPLTYAWTQTGGAVVVLSSNTAQKPTFTPAVCGNYDFSLIVNDTNINSAADSVTIKVNCVPIANAGPDQFINQPGVLVTLDGSASSDANLDPLTYAWTQTAGPVVVLSNPAAAGPTFTPALPGVYTFSLIVNDGIINSAADTVTITVNTVPVANAGPDQLVIQPAVLVTLDGSASADADGDPITYAWTQTGGAAVVLSSNTAQKPTFTPATCGNYTFSLVVNDSHINSSADSVAIRINCVPVANAGPDQLIIQPSVLVTLDGSASSDADGDPLTYAWTQTGGAAVVLSNPAAAGPTFTPAAPGIYTFSLIVNDSHINSSADTVVITVNTVPVANAGPDQLIIQPSVLVTLDGSASSDADGDPLTYAWAQTGGAAVVLSSNTAQKPTFTPATCGNYTFSLVVNDSHINSAADSVAIRINCVPVANAGPDQAPPAPGALVTLDGSASSDADGDPLTYAWTQTGGAAVVLSSNTAQKPTFTPATCGNYDFSLIVNDTHINSAADSVTIKVNCVPVANAGPDQFINQPAILVTLDGSASSDANLDPLTYAWTQTAGPAVVLSNPAAVGPTFTPALPGVYTFSLIVNDGIINSAADTVTITVNTVPVANAGPDQLVIQPGVLVTLDGSASADADGDPITYAWTQTSGAAVVLSSNTAQSPTFTPAACGNYTFSLVVNDTHINSAADSVAIRINCVPIANAGPDQAIPSPGVLVTLDGLGSSDADSDPLTYAWTQTGGTAVVLSNPAAVSPTFTPPLAGAYTFQLIVNDGHINSAADFVVIATNFPPVVDAGPDQLIIQPSVLVTLDGSASSDANLDPLTYAWTQTGGAAVVLSSATAQKPTFTPAACGNYTFSLVVNDGQIDSPADSVVIRINCVPVANAGPDQSPTAPGSLITLDGSASADADLDPLTYAWTQTAGAAVVLSSATAQKPTFTPATCDTYSFSLVVNDSHINSAADSVTIKVNCVPVANAGPDQFINQPATLITLDGSASSDANLDPLTYAWTQTAGPAVVLSNPAAVGPTFTPVSPGTYTFSLIVNDGIINSAADTVTITVNAVPVANAGPDQLVIQPGVLVTLDGSASADADGDPITYAWAQTSGAAVVLSSNIAQSPTFTPAVCGNYVFSLVVNDTHINSAADSVAIRINCVPVANAGPDQAIPSPGVLVTLDGSGSSDADSDPLTYAWTQTGGAAVVLSNPAAVSPTFTPTLAGVYTFQLIVNDGHINSAADFVIIATNFPPVADAGPDQLIIQPSVLVTLDGSVSSDANLDPLTYAWTQTSGAAVVLSSATAQKPTFTPATCGNYIFSLVVNDGQIDSPADSVVIRINCVPVANAGPDQAPTAPGSLITLDGSASADADGDPLTYAWTQTSGAAVVLSSNTAQKPTFTPATCDTYTFSLVVNDTHINSAADSVTIKVNCVPVANAGSDQFINQPATLITLDGSVSSDANLDPLTYAWTQIAGPAVILSSAASVGPTFTPASPGTYTFSLIVNDGIINSFPDTVTIIVNTVPVANAGPDQLVIQPGVLVALDGSASADADGDPITYAWTQTSGAAVVLSSNTAQSPTFTPVACGNYTFSLVVNDTHINSAADSVAIRINCVPVANAGADQAIPSPGVLVTLNGSGSSDADGDPLTYAWTQTSGPAVIVLSNPAAQNPTFTPPVAGAYIFQLTVNDGHINSAADSVVISTNFPPVADAGPDQLVIQPGVLATLDGSASSDANLDPLTYAWTQTGGAAVVLSSATAQKPTFTPVACGNYTFSLIVNDGQIDSPADSVLIRINCVPVANAGPDQLIIQPSVLVTLDGSASSDADGDPLTYAWTQTGGPAAVLSSNTAQQPTFTPALPGTYIFNLVVNDGHINSAADTVTIVVNTVPVANAGLNQSMPLPNLLVTLDGSASSDADGDPLTYAWTQISGPAVVTLSSSTAVNPTFTPTAGGAYVFQLIVNDGHIDSAPDTVQINVNLAPVANAGPDQFINQPGTLVTLDGSASADPLGDPITYLWTQTSGPAAALSNSTIVNPTFTPGAPGVYVFQLVVNDGIVNSPADTVTITVNTVPVANAGPDQLVIQPAILITLDGSASADADGDPITYAWTQTGGAAVTLSSNTAQQPTFTPAAPGIYTFNLIVNDSHINSPADTVVITVNTVPVANAGPDQSIAQPGLLVTLDGSASSDADGDPITYAWTQTSGPAALLSSATAQKPTFTPALPGTYIFQLIVNDGLINSAPDSVTVIINTVPVANAGPDQIIIQPGLLVTLDGSASADADGDPLTYAWTQTSGAAVVLSSNTAQKPTFTPASCGNYVFSLIVNDSHINSPADSVTIRVNCVPIADAGPDQAIPSPGVLVTLDGSGSSDADSDPLTYAWTQTGGPAVVVLSNPAAVNPTFTPPVGGTYTFQLIVNDGFVDSVADTVTIATNFPPVANAGSDQLVIQPGILAALDGSASSDANGDPLTYAWTQTSGLAVVLSSNTAVNPAFTPAVGGTYVFSLTVNDGYTDSIPDTVTIRVNFVPVANAGPDQFITAPGLTVTLDGSASSDTDLDPLTYAWTQTGGAPVVLSSATSINPTFTPVSGGTYIFSLIVNDGHINSPSDTVVITINNLPVADAGPDQIIPMTSILVTLDGSASSDADGDPITYSWTQTSGPAVTITGANTSNPTFTPTINTTYTFQLIVNDGFANSAADTVSIRVNKRPDADAGANLTAQTGLPVTLDGSGSSDADGDPLTYSWTQIAGPAVAISNPTAVTTTFTPSVPGIYTFQLIVNDGYVDSLPDTVDYDIFAAPNPPTSLVLTTPAPKTIVINWTPPTTNTDGSPLTNLAGYNVYRSSTSGGPYTLVTTVGVTATYTETNVKPYKTFCYVLQTITSSVPQGRSVYSMEVCGSTQPAPYVFKTQCGNPNEPGNVVPATTPGYFNRPSGIALDGAGFVFIADTENNRVQKFTTSCAYVSMWGGVGTANGKFVKPGGIVYNPTNSYVYVADGYNRVQYFTTTGVYVGKFTVAGPLSIAVDSAGNLWITNRSGLVYQYTSAGVLMNTFNSNGASGVDIKPSTGLIIGDAFNNKIGYYSTAGALLNAVGGTGSTTGLFNSPYGVSGDNSGNTYVADSLNNRVQVLDSVYDPINVIGSYGYSAGQMINPKDIDVDSAGSVYVLDQYNNRLQIYDAP